VNFVRPAVSDRVAEGLLGKFGSEEVLDALPIGVCCLDREGRVVRFNREAVRIWGGAPETGTAHSTLAQRLFASDGTSIFPRRDLIAEVLRHGHSMRDRRLLLQQTGVARRPVVVSAEPLRDGAGALVGAVLCFQEAQDAPDGGASPGAAASDDLLQEFSEDAPVAQYIVRGDGTVVCANKAQLRLLGYSIEEYAGRHFSEFFASPALAEAILTMLAQGQILDRFPAQMRARDGSIRHVIITSNVHLRNGEVVSTRCFVLNMTEVWKQARESESQFREFFDALPAAMYTTDAEGRLTFCNRAAVALAGREPQLGRDRWCVMWRLFTPEGNPLPLDQCPLAVALKEARPVRGAEAIGERPDGTRVRFIAYPSPLFGSDGTLSGAVNMLVDITDRNRAEVESANLAAIVASSNDAIISKTLDGVVTSWNAAATRIFGYRDDEMIGAPITRIVPKELYGDEQRILARLKRGERLEHYETVRLTKDGRRLDISLTVSPVRDKSGRLIGASNVSRDISEQKTAQKLQRLLVEELNHRVKNTLAIVQAIANQTVHFVKSPSEFAASFGGRLQALAQAHALLTHNSWQGADVGTLIRDQLVLGGVDDDRISYAGPRATLDAQTALHLALLLHELGTNARKYGALSVRSGRLAVQWFVQSNDERSLLLQWKEQDGPPVASPVRRGFGTALIEQSLDAHGGEATLRYEPSGLTCVVKLPLQADSEGRPGAYGALARAKLMATSGPGRPVRELRGLRVLVVDDEPLVAMDVVATLEEAGCKVVGPAATLEKARALIADGMFDIALLDANLGGCSVDELAEGLAQRKIPFCFITGYGRDGLPESFRQVRILSKPFSHQQLLDSAASLAETAVVPPLPQELG
jgi:PAS domain S-box-containing protein